VGGFINSPFLPVEEANIFSSDTSSVHFLGWPVRLGGASHSGNFPLLNENLFS
jgi:hypothetical protein